MRIAKLLLVPALLLVATWFWRRLGDDATVDIAPPVEKTGAELTLGHPPS